MVISPRRRFLVLASLLIGGLATVPAVMPSSRKSGTFEAAPAGRQPVPASPADPALPEDAAGTRAETPTQTVAGPLALRRDGPGGTELLVADQTVLTAADVDARRLRIRATGPAAGPIHLVLIETIGAAPACAHGFRVLDLKPDGKSWLSDAIGTCPDGVLATPLHDALLIETRVRSPKGIGPLLHDEAWIYRNGELIPVEP